MRGDAQRQSGCEIVEIVEAPGGRRLDAADGGVVNDAPSFEAGGRSGERNGFRLVDRNFTATRQNSFWVSDLTFVATWRGFVCVALVIDVVGRRIIASRVSSSLATDFVLDALKQAK